MLPTSTYVVLTLAATVFFFFFCLIFGRYGPPLALFPQLQRYVGTTPQVTILP